MNVRLRAWSAVLVVVGYFVMLVAILVLLPLAGLTMLLSSVWLATLVPSVGTGVIYLGYLALVGVVWRLRAKFAWVRQPKVEPPSVWVTRATHPELWRMVDELVAVTGTSTPNEVKIVAVLDVAVREDTRLLGLRRGRRHLVISLPLLAGLTVDELRAVLSRELAHFSSGQTGLNAVIHRATVATEKTTAQLTGFFRWAFASYARLFLWVAKPVNDAQELASRAAAVQAAGKEAAYSALLKVVVLRHAWPLFWWEYFELARQARRTPDLLQGFRAFLADPQRLRQLVDSSYPTVSSPFATDDTLADPDRPAGNRPAWQLVNDPVKTLSKVDSQFGEGLWPRASWAEIVKIAGAADVAGSADDLAALARQCGLAQRGDLAEILDAIDRGDGPRLMAAGHLNRDELIDMVNDTIVDALIRDGLAHHELTWSGPALVRLADGEPLTIREWLGQAIDDPFHLPELRQWLAQAGLRVHSG